MKTHTNTGNTIKCSKSYQDQKTLPWWRNASDSAPVQWRTAGQHTGELPCVQQRRQLVEVHRVTTPLSEMCRDCFDWQLFYLGLTVPPNKWLWQLLSDSSPPQDSKTSSQQTRSRPPSVLSPGNLSCWGELNCMCVHVWGWGVAVTVLKGVSFYTVGLDEMRGPVIKPLKYLRDQSITCVWVELCKIRCLPIMHASYQWTCGM